MAENQSDRSGEDLTEEASPYRLEEFRRKGQVAQSRELTGLLALVGAGVAAYALSPKMGQQMAEFMREVFRTDLSARMDLGGTHVAQALFMKALGIGIMAGLPICMASFVLGVIGSFIQVGTIWSMDPLTPKFEKIDPIAGFKRVFSMKNVTEGVRMVIKMVAVTLIAYGLIKTEILKAPTYMGTEPISMFGAYAYIAKVMFLSLVGILAVFAGVDFGLQKWEFGKSLRMTKQEAKQEHKEREGDPQMKARIRGIQREISRRRMMQAVKKADVIITNPTHIAIALVYDKSAMFAPRVVAKGVDFMAQKIKKIAADAGVPLVENVPLARTLHKTVKIGQPIPKALYQAVAEVLAYVYRLKGRGV